MMKIVTANRLIDGAVVYLGAEGQWLTTLTAARVATSDEAEAALLAEAKAAIVARKVVGAYAMPVGRDETGALVPQSWRERIRAGGPSVGNSSVGHSSGGHSSGGHSSGGHSSDGLAGSAPSTTA